jgi:hypothetical protein
VPGSPLIPYSEPIIELPTYLLHVIHGKQKIITRHEHLGEEKELKIDTSYVKKTKDDPRGSKKRKFKEIKRECCDEDGFE